MKNKLASILAASILFSANFASAADEGAAAAPAEINHQKSVYFTEPDFYTMKSKGSLTILSKYPTYQQTTEYTCGSAAALTVFKYYNIYYYDEMQLAAEMKTSNKVGTNPADMVNFFKSIGWNVQSSLDSKPFKEYAEFQNFVIENLKNGRPIMVENIEWGGHWRVIIGYDSMKTDSYLDDVLIFADPYDTSDHKQDGYTVGSSCRFFSMWFDHALLPEDQRNQPYVIAYPN